MGGSWPQCLFTEEHAQRLVPPDDFRKYTRLGDKLYYRKAEEFIMHFMPDLRMKDHDSEEGKILWSFMLNVYAEKVAPPDRAELPWHKRIFFNYMPYATRPGSRDVMRALVMHGILEKVGDWQGFATLVETLKHEKRLSEDAFSHFNSVINRNYRGPKIEAEMIQRAVDESRKISQEMAEQDLSDLLERTEHWFEKFDGTESVVVLEQVIKQADRMEIPRDLLERELSKKYPEAASMLPLAYRRIGR